MGATMTHQRFCALMDRWRSRNRANVGHRAFRGGPLKVRVEAEFVLPTRIASERLTIVINAKDVCLRLRNKRSQGTCTCMILKCHGISLSAHMN